MNPEKNLVETNPQRKYVSFVTWFEISQFEFFRRHVRNRPFSYCRLNILISYLWNPKVTQLKQRSFLQNIRRLYVFMDDPRLQEKDQTVCCLEEHIVDFVLREPYTQSLHFVAEKSAWLTILLKNIQVFLGLEMLLISFDYVRTVRQVFNDLQLF